MWKRGLSFAQDLSLEKSADSYFCFRLALLHSLSCCFFLYQSPSSLSWTVFDSISSSLDEALSTNPFANVFVFGDFNVHHKDWLSYSDGTDRPGKLCYNFFLSQMILLRWLTFLLGSLNVTLTILLFWIYSFLLTLAFVLQWLSLHWEILFMLLSQFPFTFHHHIHNGMHFQLLVLLSWFIQVTFFVCTNGINLLNLK